MKGGTPPATLPLAKGPAAGCLLGHCPLDVADRRRGKRETGRGTTPYGDITESGFDRDRKVHFTRPPSPERGEGLSPSG
ncbi:MAG: hypothetical protein LBP92_03215 [Deltaproteobacteria bacterium]|nr:hypothetical protein [Deltaproteobacteria bacterium]